MTKLARRSSRCKVYRANFRKKQDSRGGAECAEVDEKKSYSPRPLRLRAKFKSTQADLRFLRDLDHVAIPQTQIRHGLGVAAIQNPFVIFTSFRIVPRHLHPREIG